MSDRKSATRTTLLHMPVRRNTQSPDGPDSPCDPSGRRPVAFKLEARSGAIIRELIARDGDIIAICRNTGLRANDLGRMVARHLKAVAA